MIEKINTRTLNKYLKLIKNNPSLFQPNDVPLKIIIDKSRIDEWQSVNSGPENEIGVLLEDRYITVIRDLVEFPDGNMAGYNRIVNTAAFKNGGVGSVILPIMKQKILLIKVFRHPIRKWSYEIPRGFGEPGLSPKELAQKEISEEVGGRIKDVISLGTLHSNSGLEGNNVQLFLANLNEVGDPRKPEGIEEILWVNLNQLEEMIVQGQITDGFTISAYARAKLMGLLE